MWACLIAPLSSAVPSVVVGHLLAILPSFYCLFQIYKYLFRLQNFNITAFFAGYRSQPSLLRGFWYKVGQQLQVHGKPGLTMALSPCVVPLGILRVGALRPATLAAAVYPVILFVTFDS